MAVVQSGSIRFSGYALLEHYWLATDPRPTYRDLLPVWPPNMTMGVSASEPYAQEAPPVKGDPVVAALYAKSNYYGAGPH